MDTISPPERSVYNLGLVNRLPPGEGRVFLVRDTTIAVFRTRGGDVFATQPECPHKRGPLIDGLVGAGKVVCPLHGYQFDLATGQPVGNTCQALKTYPVVITETGDMMLCLDT